MEEVLPPHLAPSPWKAVLDGICERFDTRGWPKETVMLGTTADRWPRPETTEFYQSIAPETGWYNFSHKYDSFFGDHPDPRFRRAKDTGLRIGQVVTAWPPQIEWPREDGILGGWNLEFPNYSYMRNFMARSRPFRQWRMLPEASTATSREPAWKLRSYELGGWQQHKASTAGFDRMPFDFWSSQAGRSSIGPRKSEVLRHTAFPGICRNNIGWLVLPHEGGPVPTICYEMLREGLQEREARIVLEEALLNHADRLPEDLEKQCRDLLRLRLKALTHEGALNVWAIGWVISEGRTDFGMPENWREVTARLFDLAGEVQHVLHGTGIQAISEESL